MRNWKKMVAGGAAMLISVGVAHAGDVEPDARGMSPARQESSWNAYGAPSDPARAKAEAAVKDDGSGFVTHDELDKASKELIERVERDLNPPPPASTFTDAG